MSKTLEQAYTRWANELHNGAETCDVCNERRVRVRITAPDSMLRGSSGTVYYFLPGRMHEWHVRPDGWSLDEAGIAYAVDEIELITD